MVEETVVCVFHLSQILFSKLMSCNENTHSDLDWMLLAKTFDRSRVFVFTVSYLLNANSILSCAPLWSHGSKIDNCPVNSTFKSL
jgi:hypothetical protein